MVLRIALLAAIFLVAAPGAASAQSDPARRAAMDATLAHARCQLDHVQRHAAEPGTPEAVADAAIAACSDEARRMDEVFVRSFGSARGLVAAREARDGSREDLIAIVNEQRGPARPNDSPQAALGMCIRDRGAALAPTPGTPEALAAEVFRQCAAEVAAVRAVWVRSDGAEVADQRMGPLVAALQQRAADYIAGLRAAR